MVLRGAGQACDQWHLLAHWEGLDQLVLGNQSLGGNQLLPIWQLVHVCHRSETNACWRLLVRLLVPLLARGGYWWICVG